MRRKQKITPHAHDSSRGLMKRQIEQHGATVVHCEQLLRSSLRFAPPRTSSAPINTTNRTDPLTLTRQLYVPFISLCPLPAACPFGQRCSNIHDPRAIGAVSSWLPHTDVPIANLPTSVNVDALYHTRHALVPPVIKMPRRIPSPEKVESNEMRKSVLQIRLLLHETLSKPFVYSPTHFINNELCMIHGQYGARRLGEPINNVAIRRKAFAEPALQQSPSTSNATECPDKGGNADLLVLDVSFGAKADEKSPPRMLLFNPDLTAIRQCTLQSVKKHKRQSRQGRTASSPTSQSPVLLTDYSEPLARQINIAAEKTSMFSVLSTSDAEWAEFHRACLSYELCSTTTRRDASCGDTVDALDVVYER